MLSDTRVIRRSVGSVVLMGIVCVCPLWSLERRSGQEVVISEGEVIGDDLVVDGDTVKIKGRVEGDVVAMGRLIVVEGVVEGDLMAAGQAVVIDGQVGDDVRIAGMTLKVEEGAVIGDDLFAAGFSFESEAGSRVGGTTSLKGYQSRIAGLHEQDLFASLVGLRLEGRVGGDIEATVRSEAGPAWWLGFMDSPVALPTVESGLVVEDDARIEGELKYTSKAEAEIASNARVAGDISHETPPAEVVEEPTLSARVWKALREFSALLIVGVLLMWLLPLKIRAAVGTLVARPWASLGWGLLTLVAAAVGLVVVLAIAGFLTVLLVWLGIVDLAALLVVLGLFTEFVLAVGLWTGLAFVAPVIVALALGGWLRARLAPAADKAWLSLVLGLAVLVLIGLIPLLGSLASTLVGVVGLGATSIWLLRRTSVTAW